MARWVPWSKFESYVTRSMAICFWSDLYHQPISFIGRKDDHVNTVSVLIPFRRANSLHEYPLRGIHRSGLKKRMPNYTDPALEGLHEAPAQALGPCEKGYKASRSDSLTDHPPSYLAKQTSSSAAQTDTSNVVDGSESTFWMVVSHRHRSLLETWSRNRYAWWA